MSTETDLWVATRNAVIVLRGVRVAVQAGDAARVGHPVLAVQPGLFAPLRVKYDTEGAEPDPGVTPIKRGARRAG